MAKSVFIKYLESFNIFSPEEIDKVSQLAKVKTLAKGEYFTREDRVCKTLAFVNTGILRSFYYSTSGDEITYCFTFPENFITAYSSFISREKTAENIQSITDTELLVIPKHEIDQLEESSRNWLYFSKIMAEQQYIALENRVFQLQKEKAEVRYERLLQEKPEYIQKIPLHYLASYLGITQRHLSRLRKNMAN